ncbi:ImmA/IrrE family metallo-endopeptidase [Streptococcus ferus]|uniref:ImmA/IrrE family metallo-endopeptidase n=1 Tax=Streptococcus ferus TaxID=1345 RepID=UPI0035A1A661
MTIQELCDSKGVELCYFDGSVWHSDGFYNPTMNVLALDINLSDIDKKRVALHELGHLGHDRNQYLRRREQFELQADRNMIHHLIKEELANQESSESFNYLAFMEKYKLKTIANETMVKEEYLNIIKDLN